MANSSLHNYSSRRIVKIEEAIVRLGTKRVAELAMAVGALNVMRQELVPWMDVDLEWRRSIAAGVALECLLEHAPPEVETDGQFLSVILHAMGRYVLATLFPSHYEAVLKECALRLSTLEEAERQIFPDNQASVLANLLEQWKLPVEIYRPLDYLAMDFSALASLPEHIRTRVEMIKIAILLGQIAHGSWMDWDSINLVDKSVLTKWGIEDTESLIERIRHQTTDIISEERGEAIPLPFNNDEQAVSPALCGTLPYWNGAQPHSDLLRSILSSAGFVVEDLNEQQLAGESPAMINAFEGMPQGATPIAQPKENQRVLVSARQARELKVAANHVVLPCSFAALTGTCRQICISSPAPADHLATVSDACVIV
jgi:hypothetical protein